MFSHNREKQQVTSVKSKILQRILEVWIVIKQGYFKIFEIIFVLPVVDLILCFKKKDLNGRESIFKQIYELSDVF